MKTNPNRFQELMLLSFKNDQPHSLRASWLLSKCVTENDNRIKKDISKIINTIKIVPDGQQRDLINVLRKTANYDDYSGELFEICVQIWTNPKKIVSARITALKLLMQITKKHPELYQEIKLITQEDYTNSLSKSMVTSIQKMMFNFENQ